MSRILNTWLALLALLAGAGLDWTVDTGGHREADGDGDGDADTDAEADTDSGGYRLDDTWEWSDRRRPVPDRSGNAFA